MNTPFADLRGIATTLAKINNAYTSVGDVMDRTLKDMISRAPGKIASAVTSVYGIKKSEIKYSKDFKKKSAGNISVHGATLSSLEFRYAGRVLTPTHFSMTPKTKPAKKKYKVTAKIKKKAKAFNAPSGGGVFLAPASKSSTIIPWMRKSSDRLDIAPIKTLSLPQMIGPSREGKGGNKQVMAQINRDLSELVQKRFDHHLASHFKKCL